MTYFRSISTDSQYLIKLSVSISTSMQHLWCNSVVYYPPVLHVVCQEDKSHPSNHNCFLIFLQILILLLAFLAFTVRRPFSRAGICISWTILLPDFLCLLVNRAGCSSCSIFISMKQRPDRTKTPVMTRSPLFVLLQRVLLRFPSLLISYLCIKTC